MKESGTVKRVAAAALSMLLCIWGAAALAQSYYGDSVLRVGARNQDVLRMQEDLADLGYYTGNVTGHYGNLTKEAVRRFQRKNGLAVDGVAGPMTLTRLAEIMGGRVLGGEAGPSVWTGDVSGAQTLLKLDSRGEAVQTLQENLHRLEYYDGEISGHYGRKTKEAVRLFQKDHELTADGVAGPKTLAKLEEALSGVSAPETTPGAPGETAKPGETVKPDASANGGEKKDALDTSVTLRYGKRSEHVRRLQEALKTLGYFEGETTGYYGMNTTSAVERYQGMKGLTEDGIAGRATLSALNRDLAAIEAAKGQTADGAATVSLSGVAID